MGQSGILVPVSIGKWHEGVSHPPGRQCLYFFEETQQSRLQTGKTVGWMVPVDLLKWFD